MRYIIGVFAVLVLLVLIVVLIFRGSSSPRDTKQAVQTAVNLTNFENTPATASFTIRGQINGDESHRSIRISVTKEQRTLEILEGYNETATTRQTFANNQKAFSVFLSALQNAGFTNQKSTTVKDERGVCPLGRFFEYRLQNGSEQPLRSWGTNCSPRDGTFAGVVRTVQRLFQEQIPEYRDTVHDVDL